MEVMEDENAKISQDLPSMESEIHRIQTQLVEASRKTRMIQCYKSADPEATVSFLSYQNTIKNSESRSPLLTTFYFNVIERSLNQGPCSKIERLCQI